MKILQPLLLASILAVLCLIAFQRQPTPEKQFFRLKFGDSKLSSDKAVTLLEQGYKILGSSSEGASSWLFFERSPKRDQPTPQLSRLQSEYEAVKASGSPAWKFTFANYTGGKRCGFCRSEAAEGISKSIEMAPHVPGSCECGGESELKIVPAAEPWVRSSDYF